MTMAADKQDKVLNVPTLRFPEFSGDWKESTIGKEFELYSGNTPSRLDKENFVGDVNWITSGELKDHYIGDTKEKISENSAKENNLRLLPEGTFVIAIYGLEAEGVRSTGSIITKQSTISQACMAFTPKGIISNEFLYSWYKKHGNVIGIRYAQGTKQQNLSYDIIEKFKIRYPSLKEQDKLNFFISLLDTRITTQIKIIEDLKSLSDVICERLYNPSEKESWQTYKYADLFSISNERNSKLQYTNVLSASQEYGMIERNELNIDIKFEASSIKNYKIVRPNQYVIHLRSFQGGFAYSDKTGVCSPAYTILVPNEKLSTAFLKYYFTSKKFINSLRIVTYGIRDGRSISVEEFLQLKVAIPDIAHQQHIVRVMRLWEEKIWIEESYLTKLQQQKQFLLTTMFV
jgi:type I restriction enzyme S subunit